MYFTVVAYNIRQFYNFNISSFNTFYALLCSCSGFHVGERGEALGLLTQKIVN